MQPASAQPPQKPGKERLGLIGTAALVLIVIGAFSWFSGSEEPDSEPPPLPPVAPAPEVPKPPPEPTLEQKLARAKILSSALKVIEPAMQDHHGSDISPAAAALALWMAEQTPGDVWEDLDAMSDSKRKEIEKDVVPYRGKKLCTRGRIIQIFTDRSVGFPVYYGVLGAGWTGFVRFVAVGSTEGLVENSHTRFCGIVIGIHSYDNRMGGSTSGVEVVGLFDLKENRTR